MTLTNYKKLNKEISQVKLNNIIKENLINFLKILKYNKKLGITFHRFTQSMIPLATVKDINLDYITPFQKEWENIRNFLTKYPMRLDTHPDQFCVLNSINPEIVQNSIAILEFHWKLQTAMGLSPLAVIHIGSCAPEKEEAITRFKKNFSLLPDHLKQMIMLENDDKTFTIIDTLTLCEELNIPMVLDYHHYQCNHENEKLKDYLFRIFNTWSSKAINPKIHFSSPKSSKEKRSHSTYANYKEFIKMLKLLEPLNKDIDIMLEVKGKEEALFRLTRQLSFFTKVRFTSPTVFEINKSSFTI